jgi:hypothetical protein
VRKLSVALCLSLAAVATAQERLEFEFDAPVFSRYVWRGLNVTDGPVVQPSLAVSSGAWSLGFWGNVEREDSCTEFDATVAFSESLGDWGWSAGLAWYEYPNTGYQGTGELFLSLVREGEWAPFVELYGDVGVVRGGYLRFGIERSLFSGDCDDLCVGVSAGVGSRSHNDYYFANDKAGPVDAGVLLCYTRSLRERSEFSLFTGFSSLLDRSLAAGNGKRSNFVLGAGMTVRF